MEGLVELTIRLIQTGKRIYARKWSFLGFFLLVFTWSVFVLAGLNLLPEASQVPTDPIVNLSTSPLVATTVATSSSTLGVELPVKIAIPAINLAVTIANPITTNVNALDQLLLRGAVRYPTSAELGENGNVILFGHSSYLPIVFNQSYKTFDGIQRLTNGDLITVYSSDAAYVYAVQSVTKESANDATIPLSVAGRVLTLSTCDSFGKKTDRFVVVANFVESHPISG